MPDPDGMDEMIEALRSCVKSGALSQEHATGHLATVCELSQARAADLMREPEGKVMTEKES